MKINYSRKQASLKLLLSALFMGFLLLANAQSAYSPLKKNTTWKKTFEKITEQIPLGFISCTKMSKGEDKLFEEYFGYEIINDRKQLLTWTQSDSINESNADAYINQMVTKYVGYYHQLKFQKFFKMDMPYIMSIDTDAIFDSIRPDPGPCQPGCTNIGFENGTLDGWIACDAKTPGKGEVDGIPLPYCFQKMSPPHLWRDMDADCSNGKGGLTDAADAYSFTGYPKPDWQARIMSWGNDYWAGSYVPRVCPLAGGGKYSVLLGDTDNVNCGVGILEQKFMVTKDNANFTYMYAAFLENPGHPHGSQPYFRVNFMDQNGDTLKDCGNYFLEAGPNMPGWYPFGRQHKPGVGRDTIVWVRYWTCVFVSLRKYIGQCVTVQFITSDCTMGAHAGWAYIDAKCGSLDITQSGGCKTKTLSGPESCGIQSYHWEGPGIVGPANGKDVTVNAAGVYTLTITPTEGGCPDMMTDTVKFGISSITMDIKGVDVKCKGDKTGSAIVTVSGDQSDYTFSWSPATGSGTSITGLGAGTYSCKIHSSCSDTILTVTITEPPALSHTTSSAAATCGAKDGSASVTENGGTPPYSYLWNTGQTSSAISGISQGNYSITVTDANSCTDKISVNIPANGSFSDKSSATDVHCFGGKDGTASVTTTAGASPISYSWNTGESLSSITGLAAGTYTCIIKDNTGLCPDTIKVTITQPEKLQTEASSKDITCPGACDGSAGIKASGGVSPYRYWWTNNASDGAVSGLCAGSYSVTLTDKNGCTISNSVNLTEPSPITFTQSSTPTTCGNDNGTATVTVSGGTPGYVCSWSNGASTLNLANLAAATYTLSVTDSKGCKSTVTVVVPNSVPFTLNATPATLHCYGDKDGSLSANVNGTSAPYFYLWNDGETTSTISNLAAGNYSVTVKDKDGCARTLTDSVTQPLPITFITYNKTICNGEEATLGIKNIQGGTLPYSYAWNTVAGAADKTVSPTITTAYTINVTDANGCKVSGVDSVFVNPTPQAAFSPIDVCVGLPTTFTDQSTITSGNISTWEWNFGDGVSSGERNPVHTYAGTGTYTVSLKVTTGSCETIIKHVVNVYPRPKADYSVSPQPTTIMIPSITFADLSNGGVSGEWTFGDLTPNENYKPGVDPVHEYPGNEKSDGESYTSKLNIVNQYGCRDSATKIINIGAEWTFFAPNTFTPNGNGKNDLFFGTGIGIIEKEMWIFDRWGNQIFHTNDLYGGWDGKVQPGNEAGTPGGYSGEMAQEDTYVWLIVIKEVFNKKHRYIGHVNIIK